MRSFSPITSSRERAKLAVYDLEWLPGEMRLRLIGAMDGRGYRSFLSVNTFLDWALSPANSGTRFYAHAGGLADINFILGTLISRGYDCEAISSGSSIIFLSVRKGRHRWFFCDSYWTLRAPLAMIAKSLGLEKGSCEFDAPLDELEAYNKLDCEILFKALLRLENELWELGGSLRVTLASCAMDLFRRAYMSETIDVPKNVNDDLRAGYHGGRVEVYQEIVSEKGYYYDINSSYPYAMTYVLPGSFLGTSRRITPVSWVHARVRTTGYCPALPYRADALYFPTGEFSGWFYAHELDQSGVEILSVDKVFGFRPNLDMAQYSEDIYTRRKHTDDEFRRLIYKLLLNSLYGKTGERRDKTKTVINPSAAWLHDAKKRNHAAESAGESKPVTMLLPGVFQSLEPVDIPHEHVALCGAVTAIARRNLREYMLSDNQKDPTIYYCDTDGFGTDRSDIQCSGDLGALKLEKTFDYAEFAGPKLYMIDSLVRAKGFPLKAIAEQIMYEPLRDFSEGVDAGEYIDPSVVLEEAGGKHFSESPTLRREIFARIVSGDPLRFRKMSRVGGQLRAGNIPEALESEGVKRFRRIARPKRRPTHDGNSVAWSVDELVKNSDCK